MLLLGGDQSQSYRLETALRTLSLLPDARLLVTGSVLAGGRALVESLGLGDRVVFAGRYAQRDAPSVYRRAHVLLHPKVNDPCPNVVLEALACGVPVVHSASGGTPELVGDGGIGVPSETSWERDVPPDPEALAAAVRDVLSRLDRYQGAARARARALRPRAVGRAASRAVRGAGRSMTPRVSVVMPVRDGERFLDEAVESILGQTVSDLELLVVDDGSTDSTPELLARLSARDARIVVHSQAPAGLTVALNAGCDLASAPLIARMDADDVAMPDRLERQIAYLDAHPAVALLGGGIVLVDEHGREIDREPGRARLDFMVRNELTHATVVMRAEAFEALGGYRFDQSEDYDLWLRFDERHDVAALAEPVIRYRLHPGQFSVTMLERQALGFLCVREAARRRRAGDPDPLDGVERLDETVARSPRHSAGRARPDGRSPTRCSGQRRSTRVRRRPDAGRCWRPRLPRSPVLPREERSPGKQSSFS